MCWSVIMGDLKPSWKGVYWALPEAFRTGPPSCAVPSMKWIFNMFDRLLEVADATPLYNYCYLQAFIKPIHPLMQGPWAYIAVSDRSCCMFVFINHYCSILPPHLFWHCIPKFINIWKILKSIVTLLPTHCICYTFVLSHQVDISILASFIFYSPLNTTKSIPTCHSHKNRIADAPTFLFEEEILS